MLACCHRYFHVSFLWTLGPTLQLNRLSQCSKALPYLPVPGKPSAGFPPSIKPLRPGRDAKILESPSPAAPSHPGSPEGLSGQRKVVCPALPRTTHRPHLRAPTKCGVFTCGRIEKLAEKETGFMNARFHSSHANPFSTWHIPTHPLRARTNVTASEKPQ